jgi:hypothetical protein
MALAYGFSDALHDRVMGWNANQQRPLKTREAIAKLIEMGIESKKKSREMNDILDKLKALNPSRNP